MGLDTTHDCWHGPYSAFGRMRCAILAAAGPVSFVGPPEENDYRYSIVGDYPMRCYMGWWDDDFMYSDPLEVLIVHSDCDGWIFPQDARKLAERLEGFIERVDADSQERVRQFIDGLKRAADDWEIVRFH